MDAAGWEPETFVVKTDDVEQRKQTSLSLMPEDVTTSLSEKQIRDLLSFLLAQREDHQEGPLADEQE